MTVLFRAFLISLYLGIGVPITVSAGEYKITQVPEHTPHQDAIYFANFGDTSFSFLYWNATDKQWTAVQIMPAHATEISCLECGKEMSLHFHNGQSIRSITLEMGAPYGWYWAQPGVWDVNKYDIVKDMIEPPPT